MSQASEAVIRSCCGLVALPESCSPALPVLVLEIHCTLCALTVFVCAGAALLLQQMRGVACCCWTLHA